ncbi:O-glycoside alpha-1,2-mannosyltransferase omh1 [Smittium culicis]|uniref:O-glycoside alpha-1,2-mannosyltransferase omh1 n=1 Tax=Smittium culicis TaxID=133412 RepID=A0A1R1XHB0_9FUNG|nr:O-glycoside alpha-1,2-mannosyltransferase omh1 [Smittium culicis]
MVDGNSKSKEIDKQLNFKAKETNTFSSKYEADDKTVSDLGRNHSNKNHFKNSKNLRFMNTEYSDIHNTDFIPRDSYGTEIKNIIEYREKIYSKNYTNEEQRWMDEISPWTWKFKGKKYQNSRIIKNKNNEKTQNAVLLVLVRNSEIENMIYTIQQFEKNFNSKYNYPYVFLNDVPFTPNFMKSLVKFTSSNLTFGLIPKAHWSLPENISKLFMFESFNQLKMNSVPYGDSESYRHMCRFYSGFFYKHPLLQEFEFYWRIEPGVDYFCDIGYDPFLYLKENNKLYSFVISIKELPTTIYSLWMHTLKFAEEYKVTSSLFSLFSTKNKNYNLCHFWSNFEIASFDFYRSSEYESYFEFLDRTGNFFYERWGDAPVHSLAAGLFLTKDQLHFFSDIGYKHDDFYHCPQIDTLPRNEYSNKLNSALKHCKCPPNAFVVNDVSFSCLPKFKSYKSGEIWTPSSFKNSLDFHLKNNQYKYPGIPQLYADRMSWRDKALY